MDKLTDAQGVMIDEVLAQEIESPGADQRFGVNFVAYPTQELLDSIATVQQGVSELEPQQYFYPSSDIHLTVFEVVSGARLDEAEGVLKRVLALAQDICEGIHCFNLSKSSFRLDRKAGSIVFDVTEELAEVRTRLSGQLSDHGIEIRSRYASSSAHLTFFRYVKPLKTSFENVSEMFAKSSVASINLWKVSQLWVTSGATWYGKQSRIQQHGPYVLASV